MGVFGYIRPARGELRVREYEAYRGVYCGLCRELGRSYGLRARLTLTYDSTFYAMLLLALRPGCYGMERKRCTTNPLKKCVYCTGGEAPLRQAAALCVLLALHKLRDERRDHGKGRWLAAPLGWLLKGPYRRAAADFPWMEAAVRHGMERQVQAESAPDATLDACADPTASVLAAVLAHEAPDPSAPYAQALWQTGYYLGRWVYIMDAADDMRKDCARGDFNCFVRDAGLKPDSPPEAWRQARQCANASLNLTMSRLDAAFALLNLQNFGPILRNVVELGLPEMQRQLLFEKEKKTDV